METIQTISYSLQTPSTDPPSNTEGKKELFVQSDFQLKADFFLCCAISVNFILGRFVLSMRSVTI